MRTYHSTEFPVNGAGISENLVARLKIEHALNSVRGTKC